MENINCTTGQTNIPESIPTDPNDISNIKGLTGIWNKGNTCYMNSAIQALSHNYLLTTFLFKDEAQVKKVLRANAKKITQDVVAFKPTTSVSPIPLELRQKIAAEDFCPSSLTDSEFDLIYKVSITGQLLQLLKYMWSRNCSVIPASFKMIFSEARNKFFYGYEQHDAEEAYSCIVQKMQEELSTKANVRFRVPITSNLNAYIKKRQELDAKKRETPHQQSIDAEICALVRKMPDEAIIAEAFSEMKKYYDTTYSRVTEIFTGFISSSTSCPKAECGFSSHKFEPFLHLSLPMPVKHNTTPLSILHCFEEYCKDEVLDEHNLWTCDGCNQKVQAHKRVQLWDAPPILVLQLNRFGLDRRIKDKRSVDYPMDGLDISPYIASQNRNPNSHYKYRLQCVINHIGGLHGGHYYSYCMDEDTLRWFKFDDHIVSVIDDKHIVTPTAYLLFYMREDLIVPKADNTAA